MTKHKTFLCHTKASRFAEGLRRDGFTARIYVNSNYMPSVRYWKES